MKTPMTMWTCRECPKFFARKGDLTRHEFLHIGYRPHVCADCGKAFAQYSGLKTHMNVHTRVKPYKCKECPAAFGDPSSCARHTKETHRSLGAYQCPVSSCKSSIKRRSAFTAHLRKHGMKYSDAEIDDLLSAAAPGTTGPTTRIPPRTAEHAANSEVSELTHYLDYPDRGPFRVQLTLLFSIPSVSCFLAVVFILFSFPSSLDFHQGSSKHDLCHTHVMDVNAVPDRDAQEWDDKYALPVLSPVSYAFMVSQFNASERHDLNKPMDWEFAEPLFG
ncbi:hypothetical protein B0H10DRAFT_1940289 [Mycena sp. CBHHK59/15]|nr:hypothetical protein B0H10DRAFT_1940289 [Mycena sp. CBHHK59/15]